MTSELNPFDSMDRFLNRLDKLHSTPAVALQIMELIQDPYFDVSDVQDCLENDPALAASILRLVNSSYYGLRQQVGSLQQAITYLGPRPLRMAVLSFGLVKTLVKGTPAAFHQTFWRRSLTMANAARKIAETQDDRVIDPDTAFATGLLADLGTLLFVQLETQRYMLFANELDHSCELIGREIAEFGFDHAAVGAQLFNKWQLPNNLIEAVAYHHDTDAPEGWLNQVTFTASLLTDVLWTPRSPQMQLLQERLREHFEIDIDALIELAVECKKLVKQSEEMFQVRINRTIDVCAVRQEARRAYELAALESAVTLDSLEAVAFNEAGRAE